jgi:hypothetical protein
MEKDVVVGNFKTLFRYFPRSTDEIKSRTTGWMRQACIEEMRSTCNILVRKPEWKRPHGRPTHR